MKWDDLVEAADRERELERAFKRTPRDEHARNAYLVHLKRTGQKNKLTATLRRLGRLEFPLTEPEKRTLRYISYRYFSGDILYNYTEEDWGGPGISTIPIGAAAMAYVATARDGGDIGHVPLAGGPLLAKINELFDVVGTYEVMNAAEEYGAGDIDMEDPEDLLDLLPPQYGRTVE